MVEHVTDKMRAPHRDEISMAQTCRPLIACEMFRAELFQGARRPSCLGEPLPWFGPLAEANRALDDLRHGRLEGAAVLVP